MDLETIRSKFQVHTVILPCPVCGKDVELYPSEYYRMTQCICGYTHRISGIEFPILITVRPLQQIQYRLGRKINE